jgi:hypothetical protein
MEAKCFTFGMVFLCHRGKMQGNRIEQLCLPERRIETVLKLAHDLPVSGHQAVRRTNDRISLGFFFPRQLQRVKQYCDSCNVCQLRARERRTDLVPIKPIERHEENFGHLQADLIGPMGTGKYQYALVSPRFYCPYNPRAAGLVEPPNATLKQIISKLIADMPSTWHKVLPLQLLCDHWTDKKPWPLDIAKSPAQYLEQLENKLQLAADYSAEHAAREQTRYVHNYNRRSRDKSFEVGERVIYLMPTSANKLTRT